MIRKERLVVGHRPDGSSISLPIITVRGDGDKPNVFMGLTAHGDEITGHQSLWYLLDHLNEMRIKGLLKIAALINTEGFNYSIRGVPLSTIDMNRIYPGDGNGSIFERVAAKIWEMASKSDFVIDVHSAGLSIPFVLIHPAEPLIRDFMEEIAYSSGLTVLYNYDRDLYERMGLERSLSGTSVRNGVPALTLELPGFTGIDPTGAKAGFIALKNMLIEIGVFEGSKEAIDFTPVIKERGLKRIRVRSREAGLLQYEKWLGSKVKEGDIIARVRNLFGEIIEEVVAPQDGYILQVNGYYRTFTGSVVATLAVRS